MDSPIAEEIGEDSCQAWSMARLHPGGPACPDSAGLTECGPAAGSRLQIAQFLAETLQDPRLRDADRTPAHGQLASHVAGVPPLDGRAPEGQPGPLLELAADQIEDAAVERAFPVVAPRRIARGRRGGDLGEPVLRLGPAGR